MYPASAHCTPLLWYDCPTQQGEQTVPDSRWSIGRTWEAGPTVYLQWRLCCYNCSLRWQTLRFSLTALTISHATCHTFHQRSGSQWNFDVVGTGCALEMIVDAGFIFLWMVWSLCQYLFICCHEASAHHDVCLQLIVKRHEDGQICTSNENAMHSQ